MTKIFLPQLTSCLLVNGVAEMQNNKLFFSRRQNIKNILLALFVTISLAVQVLSIPMLTDNPSDLIIDCPILAWEKQNGFG